MKAPTFCRILVCLTVALASFAQEKPAAEFQALQQQFDTKVTLEVQQPYDISIVDLNVKYTAALDRALETAQQAGKLEDALAIKGDREAVALGKGVPATDDDKTPPVLKQLHDTYRAAISRLAAARIQRLQPLQASFAKSLDALVASLTKEGKLNEAMAVKKHREELAAAAPSPAPATLGASAPASRATKEAPLVNSLGMKFVPVPGTSILMCIHETRRQDYAAYAAEASGADGSWKSQTSDGIPCGGEDNHPVVGVSWEDTQQFCAWLSKKEGKTYRLPTDEEWSIAVGLGNKEKRPKETTPEMLSGKESTEFPWGGDFPPKTKEKAGNYADTAWHEKFPALNWMEDYTDSFATTAPVMSFKPNKLGLYDMGGNVWEWVEDWWNAAQKEWVLRGASFDNTNDRSRLLSSFRHHRPRMYRSADDGFRCVVVP